MNLTLTLKARSVRYLSIASVYLVSLCAQAQNSDPGLPMSDPEAVGMSAERLARIGPAMQKYIDAELVPGVVTLIARKGKVVHFESQGFMDIDSGKPMRPDAIFRIASMTKPITSVALMMLWEEGHFQLRDPVSKFIPEFADQMSLHDQRRERRNRGSHAGESTLNDSRHADSYGRAGE